ncbi:MAG: LytR C-terminal domain-containing protein [Actinomycetota bacterium]|nr:LytR C-terminal domain-containing protein [Actinomycetota bacterium]MDD5668247.1 LytR C-terminal domain-containing protein [Actinomycetota bacterium]
MSEKKAREDISNGVEREAAGTEKEKLSRLNKRRRKEARKKRRAIVAALLLIVGVLAVGSILDIPYINIARRAGAWIGERFSSGGEGEKSVPHYPYFTSPQGSGELEGEVAVLACVYAGERNGQPSRDVLGIVLLTYDRENGGGEVYLIPEASVAYNAEGGQTDLMHTLREEGGEDLLRSTVSNLAGIDVDYMLFLEFWGAVKLLQGLRPPQAFLAEQTVLVNPLNGETDFLVPGVEIGDADRLILYLLASDELETWAAFSARLERTRAYLPELFSAPSGEEPGGLEEVLSGLEGSYHLEPGAGSAREDARYLASMLRSFSELDEGGLSVKAVPAVEVLNGCGVPDLGKKVGERLGSLGVPVAGTGGNAKITVDGEEINDFTHETSTIIARSQDSRVEAFARYLGVLLSVVDIVVEPGPGAEIILIAGRDMAV